MSTWLEKRIGFLLTTISVLWAAYYLMHERVVTERYLTLGPMQLFMLGLMAWLHGRFRRSMRPNRA